MTFRFCGISDIRVHVLFGFNQIVEVFVVNLLIGVEMSNMVIIGQLSICS